MKRILYFFLAALLLIGPLSCKKDDPAPVNSLATAPDAKAANDALSGGIYKGALIGSSGIIKITLQDGVKQIEITLDGVKRTLTTTSLASWTSGQAIVDALFSSGDWQVTLSVDADGQNLSLGFTIAGHPNISGVIVKETSTYLVRAFEGTYAGSESGTWNFVIQGQSVYGISTGATGTTELYGSIAENVITFSSVSAAGTLTPGNPDTVAGEWQGSTPNSTGTWTGKRCRLPCGELWQIGFFMLVTKIF